jgi:predicted DsbA family dithiol-disulfide isomerase
MSETLSVDVWSDVVCPFCYLGSQQLTQAIERFEHDVTVTHHAFELDPNSPASIAESLEELVATKYQMPVERANALHRRLEAQANEVGLTFNFAIARPANSLDAHRLIALAATQGLSEAMSIRLFRAYFTEGLLISDRAVLSDLAREVGVRDALALWDGEDFVKGVRADEESAHALGINGVPAFVIDQRVMVSGAQGVEAILGALRDAWESRAA